MPLTENLTHNFNKEFNESLRGEATLTSISTGCLFSYASQKRSLSKRIYKEQFSDDRNRNTILIGGTYDE